MTESHALPALFVGHGSPMNAVEDNPFSRTWRELAQRLPRPRAVLCISAHWETRGVRVTAAPRPQTIHDFYGFPQRLFEMRYVAPGSPELAQRVAALVKSEPVSLDAERGLDHGCWSVLCQMYPQADVPIVQLSLSRSLAPAAHYALGRELAPLRDEGVMILGSGDIVHNLGVMDFAEPGGYDWAVEINEAVKQKIVARDHAALINWRGLGPGAGLAIPTPEHYLPLLYVLAVQGEAEPAAFFNDACVMGSISMTGVRIGGGAVSA